MHKFSARQHESQQKPELDYEEITPCLKEVTLQWEEMLTEEDRDTRFSPQVVLECVRKGKMFLLIKDVRCPCSFFLGSDFRTSQV